MLQSEGPAPYGPADPILRVIEKYRDTGLSAPITSDVLTRTGVTDSLAPRVLQSLKLLELIDGEGTPTAEFVALRKSSSSEWRERLKTLLQGVYAEVFKYADPSKDGLQQVTDAFRSFTPAGQRDRMVALFLALMEFAGADVAKAKAELRTAPKTDKTAARPRRTDSGSSKTPTSTKRPPLREVEAPAFGGVIGRGSLPPAIEGLLAALPRADRPRWTQDARDKFVKTFAAVLDFSFTIVEREDEEPQSALEEAVAEEV